MAWLLTTPLQQRDGFGMPRVPARSNVWIKPTGEVSLEQPAPKVALRFDAKGRVVGEDRDPLGGATVIYAHTPVIVDERIAELLTLAGHGNLLTEVDDQSPGPQCPGCGQRSHYREFLELKARVREHGLDGTMIVVDYKGRVQQGQHEAIAASDLGVDWRPHARLADGRSWAVALGDAPAQPVPRLDALERPGFVPFTRRLAEALAAARRARDRLPPPEQRKAIRQAARLTQAEMAELVGCSKAAIGHYEAGRRDPVGPQMLRYLAVLDSLTEGATHPPEPDTPPEPQPPPEPEVDRAELAAEMARDAPKAYEAITGQPASP